MNYQQRYARKAERQRKEVALAKRKRLEKAAPDLLAILEKIVPILLAAGIDDEILAIAKKAKDIIAIVKGS